MMVILPQSSYSFMNSSRLDNVSTRSFQTLQKHPGVTMLFVCVMIYIIMCFNTSRTNAARKERITWASATVSLERDIFLLNRNMSHITWIPQSWLFDWNGTCYQIIGSVIRVKSKMTSLLTIGVKL
jgi:hypothetical protein